MLDYVRRVINTGQSWLASSGGQEQKVRTGFHFNVAGERSSSAIEQARLPEIFSNVGSTRFVVSSNVLSGNVTGGVASAGVAPNAIVNNIV